MAAATLARQFDILTQEQIDEYHHQGFLIVPGLFFQAEMEDAFAEAQRLFERRDLIATDNIRWRWKDHVETKQCLFECFDPVIDLGAACARLARDPRLMSVVASLYGEEGFLFKDKLIFKPPGALGYEMHQDFISWPNFPRSFLTAQIALETASELRRRGLLP